MTDFQTRIPLTRAGQRPVPAPLAGATLFYPTTEARPDLFLTAQILIEDLRAEGWRMSGLRISDHLLRMRLAGMELALARSDRPLPPESLHGLVRPLQHQPANSDHQPLGAERGGPTGVEGDPLPGDGNDCRGGTAPLTDLGQVRVTRALRQHQAALGVLVRRRGTQGPPDLEAALLTILRAVAEAAPPALVLWQRTGVLMTPAEFATCNPDDLARSGDPARPILPGAVRDRSVPLTSSRSGTMAAPVDADHLGRQARAARRSAGRVFGQSDLGSVVLPRIETAVAGLASALRKPDEGGEADTPSSPARQMSILAVVALWCTLLLPGGAGLQMVLPW